MVKEVGHDDEHHWVALTAAEVGDCRRQMGLATAVGPHECKPACGCLREPPGGLESPLEGLQFAAGKLFPLPKVERPKGLLTVETKRRQFVVFTIIDWPPIVGCLDMNVGHQVGIGQTRSYSSVQLLE